MGWIVLTVVAVGAAVGLTAWWLLSGLPPLKPAQSATARIDVIRTALAAGAGVGAAITLMLTFRRQRHHEIVAASTEHDASERRVTELYTKAAEQLGNAQAPVRLAGLYALERLAQINPDQRQTIVNVICAYLRMPFTPPREDRQDKIRTAQRAARLGASMHPNAAIRDKDSQEEQQVRLTAQRILTDHLRYVEAPPLGRGRKRAADPNARFWPGIRLDLTGATLLDFNFSRCSVSLVMFRGATFTGDAGFGGATFTGDAGFDGATFTGNAGFQRATFTDNATFGEATFTGNATFDWATFTGNATFDWATFTGDAGFHGTTFTGNAWFQRATFTDNARFHGTTFTDNARFHRATFTGNAGFHRATFTGNVWFSGATFTGNAGFDWATFTGDAWFGGTTFTGNVWFSGATFTGPAKFVEVRGAECVELHGARVAYPDEGHAWPSGWQLMAGRDGVLMLRRDSSGPPPDARETGPDAIEGS